MLNTKSQDHWPSGSGKEVFKVFTIYGHASHFGHVTKLFFINFDYIIIQCLHMKFEFNWANDF